MQTDIQGKVFCTINTARLYCKPGTKYVSYIIPLAEAVDGVQKALRGSGFEGLLEAREDFRMVISGYIRCGSLEGVLKALNANLMQDCCAVEVYHALDTYTALVGDNTEPYGAFNYDYFLHRGATDSPRSVFEVLG